MILNFVITYKIVIILLLSSLLDFIFGDPIKIPHPIIYIGKLISRLEKSLSPDSTERDIPKGVLIFILTVFISFAVPFAVLFFLYRINFWIGLILEIFWSFQILAARTLNTEALKVKKHLESGDLIEARRALSMIVGRDTTQLSEEDIIKAVVETVSENTTDGIVSPLIAIGIGGAPLGFAYKAVNTLDSMIGYKSEKYFYFGKASAILDDVFNYLPARLTGISMCFASVLVPGLSMRGAWRVMMRDHAKHASPNGGWTEGATAGALGVRLGGDATYFGVLFKKAALGDPKRDIRISDIEDTTKLMWASSIIILILIVMIRAFCFL